MAHPEIVESDITTLNVDAIVNAANEGMLGGTGVDGAIHAAAGPELREACERLPEVRPGVRCPVGEARITPGFGLAARYVIHTVGPVWLGGDEDEAKLLASCYDSALALAREHRLSSIAFPAISCGVYGYPLDAACAVAVARIRASLATGENPQHVYLVAFSGNITAAYRRALLRAPSL